MELKEYIQVARKNIVAFLFFAILGAILGYLFAIKLPTGYSQTQLFYLAAMSSQDSKYYTQETARNFTDTAVVILESADFKKEAQLPQSTGIAARKLAPQAISLTATAPSSEEAKDGLIKASQVFNQKMATISNSIELKAIAPSPQGSQVVYSKKILAAAGFLIGVIFATITVAAKIYFKL